MYVYINKLIKVSLITYIFIYYTRTHTRTYIYCQTQTDCFRCITTLQCIYTHKTFEAGIETGRTLR